MSAPRIEELTVVGTTTPVRHDDLPARLAPIYQDQEGRRYLPIEGEDAADTAFSLVDEWWIREQVEDGNVAMFGVPIQARPNHLLLQVVESGAPEYLAETELRRRLTSLGEEALREADRALVREDRKAAEARAWFAARATADRPLPLMLLRALLRGEIPQAQLAYLEKKILAFPSPGRAEALRRARVVLPTIFAVLSADPESGPEIGARVGMLTAKRPSYLDPYEDNATFLRVERRRLASMGPTIAAVA